MGFIHGADRHEAILFPERLDDYIAAENPIRFLDVFVDHLDLTMLGFQRATPATTGRPAYDPADLLNRKVPAPSRSAGKASDGRGQRCMLRNQ